MDKHPLVKFWEEDSGWGNVDSTSPEEGMAEGQLCIDTWNAAVDEAIETIHKDIDISHLCLSSVRYKLRYNK